MNNPLVSVIVPVYNSEKFLKRTIDSIASQTYRNLEIILVNDGSTDSSLEICKSSLLNDSRIVIIDKENNGASEARKDGIRRATGRWVMFVDSDDTIEPNTIEQLLSYDDGSYQIIVGTLNLIPTNGQKTVFCHKRYGALTKDEYIAALLLNETSVGPVAKLIDRELFRSISMDIDAAIVQNEDFLMLLELSMSLDKKVFVTNDVVCYNYIFRNNSISKSVVMPIDVWWKVFEHVERSLSKGSDVCVAQELFTYKIRRIYDCCLLKGVNINSYRNLIEDLLSEASGYILSAEDMEILSIVSSPYKSVLCSTWSKFKRVIKLYLKFILLRE